MSYMGCWVVTSFTVLLICFMVSARSIELSCLEWIGFIAYVRHLGRVVRRGRRKRWMSLK